MNRIKIIIVFLCLWVFGACSEDEDRMEELFYENYFEIKDNPSDSVQHRIFDIYQKYGVPVFFNDTIEKVFLKMDIYGDSIFRYETLDLNWKFYSNDANSVKYIHQYISNPNERYRVLGIVERFLAMSHKSLYPYSMLVTSRSQKPGMFGGSDDIVNEMFYRTLLFSKMGSVKTEKQQQNYATTAMRKLIFLRQDKEEEMVAAFNQVSSTSYYGKPWTKLDKSLPADFSTDPLNDVKATEEQKAAVRAVIGKFGFVAGHKEEDWMSGDWIFSSPGIEDTDREDFIIEMLQTGAQEFVRRWGAYPLVMQKYELLYDYVPGMK